MATTVTYKGATLTTVDNQTKVLETAGTWVEDDFTLTDVSGGGGDEKFYSLVDGSITSVDDSTITTVRQMAFGHCYSLSYVNLPNCTSVSHNSFQNCTSLVEIHMPKVTSIGNDCFNSSRTLVTFDVPNLQRAGGNSLVYCPLTNLHILPEFERFNSTIGFRDARFTVFALPKINNAVTNMFLNCNNVVTVDIGPNLANIPSQMFNGNAVLANIIFRRTSLVTLQNANGLWGNTNEPPVHKVIYVPSALISSYQTASNWSTLYNAGYITFSAIEGSQYETHYADGTVIE